MLSAPTEIATLQCQTVCFEYIFECARYVTHAAMEAYGIQAPFCMLDIQCKVALGCCHYWSCSLMQLIYFSFLTNHCTKYKSLSVQFHRDFISLLFFFFISFSIFFFEMFQVEWLWVCVRARVCIDRHGHYFPISQRCINYTDPLTETFLQWFRVDAVAIADRPHSNTHTHACICTREEIDEQIERTV